MEYAFDVSLVAAIRVDAASYDEARKKIARVLTADDPVEAAELHGVRIDNISVYDESRDLFEPSACST